MEEQWDSMNGRNPNEDDNMVDNRAGAIFRQMKSFLESSEGEISSLNCELAKMKGEKESLMERLKNRERQLSFYKQRETIARLGIEENSDLESLRLSPHSGSDSDECFPRQGSEQILLKFQLKAAEKEVVHYKKKLDETKEKKEELSAELRKTEQEMTILSKENISLQIQNEGYERQIQVLEAKICEQEKEFQVNFPNIGQMDQISRLQNCIKMLEEKTKEKDRKVENLNEEVKVFVTSELKLKNQCSSLSTENKTLVQEREQLRSELGEHIKKAKQMQSDNISLSTRLHDANNQLSNLRTDLQDAEQKARVLERDNRNLSERITVFENNVKEMQLQIEKDNDSLRQMKNESVILLSDLKQAKKMNTALERELGKCNSRCLELEYAIVIKEREMQHLTAMRGIHQSESKSNETGNLLGNDFELRNELKMEELSKINEKLLKEKKALKKRVERLQEDNDGCHKKIETLNKCNETMKKQLDYCVKNWEEHKKLSTSEEKDKATLEQTKNKLKEALRENQKLQDLLKQSIQEKNDIADSYTAIEQDMEQLHRKLFLIENTNNRDDPEHYSLAEQRVREQQANKTRIELLEKKILAIQEEVLQKNKKLAQMSEENEKIALELFDERAKYRDQENRITQQDYELQKWKKRAEELQIKCTDYDEFILDLQTCLQRKNTECEYANQKNLSLLDELNDIKQRFARVECTLATEEKEKDQMIDLNCKIAKLSQENEELKKNKQEMKTRFDSLQHDFNEAKTQTDTLKGSGKELKLCVEELTKELMREVARRAELQKVNGELLKFQAELKGKADTLTEQLERTEKSLLEQTKQFNNMTEFGIKEAVNSSREQDINVLALQYKELESKSSAEIEYLKKKIQNLLESNHLYEQERIEAAKSMERINTSMNESKIATNELSDQLQELQEKYQELLYDALALKDERDELIQYAQREKSESKTAKARVKEMSQRLTDLENRSSSSDSLKGELLTGFTKAQTIISLLEKSLKEQKNEVSEYKAANKDLHSKVLEQKASAGEQISELQQTLCEQNNEIKGLKDILEQSEERFKEYESSMMVLQKNCDDLILRNTEVADSEKLAKERAQDLERLNGEATKENVKLKQELSSVKLAYQNLKEEKQDMKTLFDLSEVEIKRTKMLLESSEQRLLFLEKQREKNQGEIEVFENERLELLRNVESLKQAYMYHQKRITSLSDKNKRLKMVIEDLAKKQHRGDGLSTENL